MRCAPVHRDAGEESGPDRRDWSRLPPLPPIVLARIVHVLCIVLWIGGVAFVTTVLIPAVRALPAGAQQIELFERLESRFALQARVTTVLAGGSGLYMLYAMEAWSRYLDPYRSRWAGWPSCSCSGRTRSAMQALTTGYRVFALAKCIGITVD